MSLHGPAHSAPATTPAGIYRGMPLRVNPRQRAYYALYKTYLDIIHIERDETAQMFAAAAPCEPSSPMAGSQDDTQAMGMPDSEEPAVHVLGNMSREELAAKEDELRVGHLLLLLLLLPVGVMVQDGAAAVLLACVWLRGCATGCSYWQ